MKHTALLLLVLITNAGSRAHGQVIDCHGILLNCDTAWTTIDMNCCGQYELDSLEGVADRLFDDHLHRVDSVIALGALRPEGMDSTEFNYLRRDAADASEVRTLMLAENQAFKTYLKQAMDLDYTINMRGTIRGQMALGRGIGLLNERIAALRGRLDP